MRGLFLQLLMSRLFADVQANLPTVLPPCVCSESLRSLLGGWWCGEGGGEGVRFTLASPPARHGRCVAAPVDDLKVKGKKENE